MISRKVSLIYGIQSDDDNLMYVCMYIVHAYLILVNVSCELCFAQFIEGNNDQGHEDVDEKEGEDDEVDDIKNGHFNSEHGNGSFIFIRGSHGILEDVHPAFSGLYSEQGHHGSSAVVVIEGFDLPQSRFYYGDAIAVFTDDEKFAP